MPELKTRDIALLGIAGAMVATALVLARPKKAGKRAGEAITWEFRFEHRGKGETIWIGVGWAKAQLIGHGDIIEFQYDTIEVNDDSDWQAYKHEYKTKVPELPPGKYDILAFIQKVGGSLRADGKGFIITSGWKDDFVTII